MPVNRNALIRYKTIDKCLQNRYRKWTLEDIIEACSEALYEYEGILKGISKRTVQADIQIMRSEKIGYNAPIIVIDKKYYTYEDPEYSITNFPLTEQDLEKLAEVVEILKQFKGFSHFMELNGIIQKLEDKIYTEQTKKHPIIDFEKNDNLKGLEYLDNIYRAIQKEYVIEIIYRSFTAKKENTFLFHPYLLKEYRNRWFILGKKQDEEHLLTLALDRISGVKERAGIKYNTPVSFNPYVYYKDIIGITVNKNQKTQQVKLFADNNTSPYILTKPLHHSQKVESANNEGTVISIDVILNFELEREIMSYGEGLKVLGPKKLKEHISKRLSAAASYYI